MRYYLITIKTCLFLFVLSLSTQVSKAFVFPNSDGVVFLDSADIDYFIDSTGRLGFDQVKYGFQSGRFEKGLPSKLYDLKRDNAYWLHVRFSKSKEPWVFIVGDPYAGEVDYFNLLRDTVYQYQSGIERSFFLRDLPYNNHVFKIRFDQDSVAHIFLKFKSNYRIGSAFLVLKESEALHGTLDSYMKKGVLYGVILLLIFYNFLLFLLMKERLYAVYAFYLIAALLFITRDHFSGFQYIWPDYPEINFWVIHFDRVLLLGSFGLFSLSFLQIRWQSTKNRIFLALWGVYAVTVGVETFMHYQAPWIYLLESVMYVMVFWWAVKHYRSGKKYVRFYLTAYAIWFIGYFIFISMGYEWFRIPGYSAFAFDIALLIETLIMTVALVDRFRELKERTIDLQNENISILEEKETLHEKINQELECRVARRTSEVLSMNEQLAEANKKLEDQAKSINEMNLLLDKDNYRLKREMKTVAESSLMGKDATFDQFLQVFPDELACLKHLMAMKWTGDFRCRRCQYNTFATGYRKYSRKCQRCGYDETVTSGTIFHNLKFPLTKAFYLVIKTVKLEKGYSLSSTSTEIDLRLATCSAFRKKVLEKLERINSRSSEGEKITKIIIDL